jgi:hypothetical protein
LPKTKNSWRKKKLLSGWVDSTSRKLVHARLQLTSIKWSHQQSCPPLLY